VTVAFQPEVFDEPPCLLRELAELLLGVEVHRDETGHTQV
jgi:hypothetical protein